MASRHDSRSVVIIRLRSSGQGDTHACSLQLCRWRRDEVCLVLHLASKRIHPNAFPAQPTDGIDLRSSNKRICLLPFTLLPEQPRTLPPQAPVLRRPQTSCG